MAQTILIVDDSKTMISSVKTTLEINKYQVHTAMSGAEALAKLDEGVVPNLVITDINMPGMSGFELIQKIKMIHKFRFLPILTLTTESSAAKRDQGRIAGATGWLIKPVSADELVSVIKRVASH